MKSFKNLLFQNKRVELYNELTIVDLLGLVIKGGIVGLVAGFVGATFRYAIHLGEEYRHLLFDQSPMYDAGWITYAGWILGMIVCAFICYWLLRWAPLSGGSGIPQIEGEMRGIFDMNPYRTLVSKYIGGIITGLAGFSVGREGPSVQLGGSVGKILSYWYKSSLRESRILTSAGAAAGLTAAFSAPVSGAIFVFEEVHKSFYPKLVIPTFSATIVANYVTSTMFGLTPSLGFSVMERMPLEYFLYIVLLGVGMGIIGVFFNRMIIGVKALFDLISWPSWAKLVFVFVSVALIGFDSQLLLGGGNDLVRNLAFEKTDVALLFWIVLGKVALTAFCYASGAQGGIFLPMLVIGSAAGALGQSILVHTIGFPDSFLGTFVICGMSGMLSATMRTPLLAILLVLEMTNSFHSIYYVGTVAILGYLTAEFCQELPIYDNLLERMSKNVVNTDEEQTFFQTKVSLVCSHVDRALKDLHMPEGSFIVSIVRGGQHIVPLAHTTLQVGDELYISCKKGSLRASKDFFEN